MMSQPNEVARVRKLASIVCRRGALAPICCRVPRGWWVVGAPLLHKGPGRAVGARPSPSDDQVRGGVDWMSVIFTELPPFTGGSLGGAVGWLARRVWPATLSSARCQGHCRLVSLSRLLCQAASRLLAGVPQAGQPIASAPPCHWPPVVLSAVYCQAHCGPGRDSDSPNWTYRGHVGT
ncbi:hypothetical protein BHE74_00058793 [Ensete ventricosum]|nr:hypothetical protein BHE74_00058793 [Ensete ventricosum]